MKCFWCGIRNAKKGKIICGMCPNAFWKFISEGKYHREYNQKGELVSIGGRKSKSTR